VRRVVITGLGAVTPAGITAPETWENVAAGRTAIAPIENLRPGLLSVPIAAQVLNFEASRYVNSKQANMMDRVSLFAVVAAREAMADCGLVLTDEIAAMAQVIIGIGVGGMVTLDDSFYRLYAEKNARLHPFTVPRLMPNAPASQVSMDLGLKGMTFAVASACASGTHAIGLAFRAIRSGDTEIAVTGGAEACVTTGTLLGWEALRVLSFDTCRPFSKDRSGLVIGEGSAILVLEELAHALARGAKIHAEIVGFGANADAGDLTSPDARSAARAMQLALSDGQLAPADVGYVNAHGTGTMMNDLVESTAIKSVFGTSETPLVSSIKGVVGHSLGAAGAIEAMATALALRDGLVPPTANHRELDPAIALDVVPNVPREIGIDAALSNSFAFGGLNAVLALRRYSSGSGG
jgi:nodulation protein E